MEVVVDGEPVFKIERVWRTLQGKGRPMKPFYGLDCFLP